MNANLKMIVAAIALASSVSAYAGSCNRDTTNGMNKDSCTSQDWVNTHVSQATLDAANEKAAAGDATLQSQIDGNTANINAVAQGVTDLQGQVDGNTSGLVKATEQGRTNANNIATNSADIATTSNHLANVEAGLTTGLQNETKNREASEAAINTNVDNVRNVANAAQTSANNANRTNAAQQTEIDANTAGVATNAGNIESLSHSFAGYQADTNHRLDHLQDDINDTRKDAFAGVSSAMAQGAIPQVTGDQKFTFGAGVGTYHSESAIAVGGSARITDNVTAKASVSTDSQSNFGASAGLSVGW